LQIRAVEGVIASGTKEFPGPIGQAKFTVSIGGGQPGNGLASADGTFTVKRQIVLQE